MYEDNDTDEQWELVVTSPAYKLMFATPNAVRCSKCGPGAIRKKTATPTQKMIDKGILETKDWKFNK